MGIFEWFPYDFFGHIKQVIEQARQQALGLLPSAGNSPTDNVSSPLPSSQASGPTSGGMASQSTLSMSQLPSVASSVVPNLGLGFPGATSTTTSTAGVSYHGLSAGTLGVGQNSFSSMMGGQTDPTSFAGMFSQHGGTGVGSTSTTVAAGLTGQRALNSMTQSSTQNPFILPQTGPVGSGNIPLGFPGSLPSTALSASTMLGATASTNTNMVGLPGASLSTMSGTSMGPGQFGMTTGSRMPMVSSLPGQATGLMNPYAMGQASQAYGGMNASMLGVVGMGASTLGGNQPRTPFNSNLQQQSNNAMGMGRGDRRPGNERAPGVGPFGKAGPNNAMVGGPGFRDRDGSSSTGFSPRGDRDTRGREKERTDRTRRSSSRSRDRKDGR